MKIHIKFYIHISASVALPMVLYKYVYDMICTQINISTFCNTTSNKKYMIYSDGLKNLSTVKGHVFLLRLPEG